jgi:pyruvate carboxylase
LTSARDLGIYTIAVYTSEDANHAVYADEAVLLNEPSDFTNVSKLVSIAKQAKADSVHPGYGFLSENPEFSDALRDVGIHFIGPTSQVLRQTANKTDARALAEASNVPTLPASIEAMRHLQEAQEFVNKFGLPIMFKAVDGGGGRGIRLVQQPQELEDSFNRACGESPSGQVFVERAAVDGFRHVEIQILADNYGNVGHLWERECSIQRRLVRVPGHSPSLETDSTTRFQKMVELAPSTISNRSLIAQVIESAMRMARSVCCNSPRQERRN